MGRWTGLVALALAGCEGAGAPPPPPAAEWTGAIDTLAGGVVQVSNPGASPGATFALREVLRIDDPSFGQIPDLVSDGEGGVWALDAARAEVVHLSAEGVETVRFGGSGEGPAAFQSPRRLHRSGDTIWVEDLGSERWSAWTTDGQPIGVVELPPLLAGGEASWTADGLVAVVSRREDDGSRVRWAGRWRAEGERFVRVDSFAPPPVPEPFALQTTLLRQGREVGLAFPLPLAHQPQVAPHPDGRRWVITPGGGDYRFHLADLGGDVRREITRDVAPSPVPEQERAAAIERLPPELREEQADRVPSTYPPFDRVVVADDGGFWLVRSISGGAPAFDVFGPDGRYRGSFESGSEQIGFWLHTADGRGVWGVQRNDAGRPVVVRLEWADG